MPIFFVSSVPAVAPLISLIVGSNPILPERPILGRADESFGFDVFFPELVLVPNIWPKGPLFV